MDNRDFLANLIKKFTQNYNLSGSEPEIKDHFRAEAVKYLQKYFEALDAASEAINALATALFETHATPTNNSDISLSKMFESEVAYEFTKWLATEETVQGNFIKPMLAYATKISTVDLDLILAEAIEGSKLVFQTSALRSLKMAT